MYQITMVFKSGKEYSFSCENYKLERLAYGGGLYNFSYEHGIGICPIYYKDEDIESIAVYKGEE